MVRIAGLRQQVDAGVTEVSADGYTPQQLLPIAAGARLGHHEGRRASASPSCCPSSTRPASTSSTTSSSRDDQRAALETYYREQVFPVLTPLAFDPGRPFPHISNMSHNLAVLVRDQSGEERFARVKVPTSLPRLVPVPPQATGAPARLRRLAPPRPGSRGSSRSSPRTWTRCSRAWRSVASYPFRVTRDAELAIQELEADDLLETIERFVRRRRFGSVDPRDRRRDHAGARARTSSSRTSSWSPATSTRSQSPLGLSSLWDAASADRPDLKYAPLVQSVPPSLDGVEGATSSPPSASATCCSTTRTTRSTRWSSSCAPRPTTRTCWPSSRRCTASAATRPSSSAHGGGRERQAGRRARRAQGPLRRGEQHRLGEGAGARGRARRLRPRRPQDALQGRSDRAPRRRRHPPLRAPGHRQLQQRHRRKQYTDLGYLTADDEIGADAAVVFNHLTGYGMASDYRKLLVAPDQPAPGHRGAHRPRDRARAPRRGGPPHLQDELAGRQADDPPALPGLAGRRAGRPATCAACAACGPGCPA